jgi:hypothetical protein
MQWTFGRIATKPAANPYGLGMECLIIDIERNGKSITEYWLWMTARSQKFKPLIIKFESPFNLQSGGLNLQLLYNPLHFEKVGPAKTGLLVTKSGSPAGH